MFANQMIWFEKLMKELKAKNIAAVLVNMPVSELGAKYIPPAVYKRHIDALKMMASKYDCLYVDTMQQNDVAFDMKDFSDYGHMDASGGRKVVDIVARAMANDPRCKSLLAGGTR